MQNKEYTSRRQIEWCEWYYFMNVELYEDIWPFKKWSKIDRLEINYSKWIVIWYKKSKDYSSKFKEYDIIDFIRFNVTLRPKMDWDRADAPVFNIPNIQ